MRRLSQHGEATTRRRLGPLLTGLYWLAWWLAQAPPGGRCTQTELAEKLVRPG